MEEKPLFEIRGRQELSQNIKQNIYNTWIKNSINSTDGRNGRNLVKLSKRNILNNMTQLQTMKLSLKKLKTSVVKHIILQTAWL